LAERRADRRRGGDAWSGNDRQEPGRRGHHLRQAGLCSGDIPQPVGLVRHGLCQCPDLRIGLGRRFQPRGRQQVRRRRQAVAQPDGHDEPQPGGTRCCRADSRRRRAPTSTSPACATASCFAGSDHGGSRPARRCSRARLRRHRRLADPARGQRLPGWLDTRPDEPPGQAVRWTGAPGRSDRGGRADRPGPASAAGRHGQVPGAADDLHLHRRQQHPGATGGDRARSAASPISMAGSRSICSSAPSVPPRRSCRPTSTS
jgi:hypothetical protein